MWTFRFASVGWSCVSVDCLIGHRVKFEIKGF